MSPEVVKSLNSILKVSVSFLSHHKPLSGILHHNMAPKIQNRKPWPSYFLVRTTGEVVPLIAVDELPEDINIVGVPRELDLEKAVGMLNLGLQKTCGVSYKITQEKAEIQGENDGLVVEPIVQLE